jgi:hypothetical protein
MDFSDDVSVTTNSPEIMGTTKIDNIKMVTREMMFELDAINYEATTIPYQFQ